jgi:DNA adenine methylase
MLLRYPGSKTKLRKVIIDKILESPFRTYYIEPFFGAGSIGINLLGWFDMCWFNDKDWMLMDLWQCILYKTDYLKNIIQTFIPNAEKFYLFKEELLKPFCLDAGFKKLAIHQMSYSGLGVKAGGPIGGQKQISNYNVGCRWNAPNLCKKIDKIKSLFKSKNFALTSWDFNSVLINSGCKYSTIYLDPPYYHKGNQLYQFGFTEEQHKELCKQLYLNSNYWVLTYDECDEIYTMYKWAKIQVVPVQYSINTSRQRNELIITSPLY